MWLTQLRYTTSRRQRETGLLCLLACGSRTTGEPQRSSDRCAPARADTWASPQTTATHVHVHVLVLVDLVHGAAASHSRAAPTQRYLLSPGQRNATQLVQLLALDPSSGYYR